MAFHKNTLPPRRKPMLSFIQLHELENRAIVISYPTGLTCRRPGRIFPLSSYSAHKQILLWPPQFTVDLISALITGPSLQYGRESGYRSHAHSDQKDGCVLPQRLN